MTRCSSRWNSAFRCKTKDPAELWAADVRKIHDYLAAKGIKTALYGDHLIESVRGVHRKPYKSKTGWAYNMPGALTPQQVLDLVPKDLLIVNWFWHDVRAAEGRGEPNDIKLSDWGFQQVHANFMYNIQNYARRTARPGVIGGAPSSWSGTTEYTFGKDLMMDFLGTANLMWSTHWPEEDPLSKIVQTMMPEVRRNLGGKAFPSETGDPVTPIDIGAASSAAPPDFPPLQADRIDSGNLHFQVQGPVVVGVTGEGKTALPLQSGGDSDRRRREQHRVSARFVQNRRQ